MISTKISYSAILRTEKVDDTHKFKALPQPSGSYPYRLKVGDPENSRKLVFHMIGDTGGSGKPDSQELVVAHLAKQHLMANNKEDQPSFLYHLGDIVYHFGEAEKYEEQFLEPFEDYPAPIYAIAGNHDSDINPDSEINYDSLDAFYAAFCNICPKTIYFSENIKRKSQIQPHVYWTMETSLATIIGLYTNVPKYGCIKKEQKNWFINELRNASRQSAEKAIVVCLHHAPYSADFNHGSSLEMIGFLESAYNEADVIPDIVFSGHVHNYQRFIKQYEDKKTVPYIVAGAGGFEELHTLADPLDPAYTVDNPALKNVQLESYCDDRHGFLKIMIEKTPFSFTIKGEYYTVPKENHSKSNEAILFDNFTVDLTGR